MPPFTVWLVTAGELPGPVIVCALPVAVSVQFDGTAVAPVVPLFTTLIRLRVAGLSSLLIVQVALTPTPSTRLLPVSVPALHDHAPAA